MNDSTNSYQQPSDGVNRGSARRESEPNSNFVPNTLIGQDKYATARGEDSSGDEGDISDNDDDILVFDQSVVDVAEFHVLIKRYY